jgi:hypothetical protein
MGWASKYIEQLLPGQTIQFRPRGNSMGGKIESGQLVTVAPLQARAPRVGDIALCKVKANAADAANPANTAKALVTSWALSASLDHEH